MAGDSQLHSFVIPSEFQGERLDRFLGKALAGLVSRERLKRAVKEGGVCLDGLPITSPATRLAAGQRVALALLLPPTRPEAEEGDIDILYRDADLLVVNKPAGLTVHPAPSCPEGTLVNRLLRIEPSLASLEGMRPGIVHRIDKDTSGLLLVALTEASRLALSGDFAERRIRKEYLALTAGVPMPKNGDRRDEDGSVHIDAPIGRHPSLKTRMAVLPGGRPAQSAWKVLAADPEQRFALVAVRIFTGRTHQIRVHMAHNGHPLLGDSLYGRAGSRAARQMLHAWKLEFAHPKSGQTMAFTCPPPPDFLEAIRAFPAPARRIILTGLPGCGKSLALRYLAEAGLPTASADAIVKNLYEPGNAGWRLLAARFGERFVPGDKQPVNKAALTRALLKEPSLRRELEDLIHPLVSGALQDFFQAEDQAGQSFVAAEAPLFLESGWRRSWQPDNLTLAGIHCPLKIRRSRLHGRGWDDALIDAIESWQWPEEKKMRACDLVVDNTGGPDDLRRNILGMLEKLALERREAERSRLEALAALWT